jgi:hypothetical protein
MISMVQCKNMFTLREKFQEAKNLVCYCYMSYCVNSSWVEGEGCELFEEHVIQIEKIIPLYLCKNIPASQREVYAL